MTSGTSTSSSPSRWRRLLRALSRALGPRLPLEDLPCVGITPMAVRAASPIDGRRLHVCVECGADAVNPAQAEPLDDLRWSMLLRCGACGATVERIVSNEAADCYDRELDRGYGEIARALARIEREGMQEWAGTFVAALGQDLIDAEDFSRR